MDRLTFTKNGMYGLATLKLLDTSLGTNYAGEMLELLTEAMDISDIEVDVEADDEKQEICFIIRFVIDSGLDKLEVMKWFEDRAERFGVLPVKVACMVFIPNVVKEEEVN